MICRYELKLRAICPIHECEDVYDLVVESSEVIYVEKLLDFVATCAGLKETQEVLTARLAKAFANARITTIGYHSNVRTTVLA